MKASEEFPVLFYGGSKGGGKSYLVRARQVLRRMQYPNTKGLIVRKTYPELLSNHIRQFFMEYPQTFEWYRAGDKAIHWPNGSITEFSHLANTFDVYNYQGREYEDIDIDEITQHEEEVFKILRSSLRTTNPNVKVRMVLTGNPGGIGHAWVKRIFIDKQFKPEENPGDFGFVQASVYDNSALMDNDPDYVHRLEDLPEEKKRAYLFGDWNIFAGQYFHTFRNEHHVIPPFIPKRENAFFIGGLDWGRVDPFCTLISVVKPEVFEGVKFSRVITFMEVYGTEQRPAEWGEEIVKKLKFFNLTLKDISWIQADTQIFNKSLDRSKSIKDQFIDENPMYTLLRPASKDRIPGWENMQNWLSMAPDGLPYWLITQNCTNLIRTLPSLVHDENKVEDVSELAEDHAPSAARYMFKALRWTDARVGSIPYGYKKKPEKTAEMVGDYQVSVNTDLWAQAAEKDKFRTMN